MKLAPFWPTWDASFTDANWPDWLKLKLVTFTEIERDGVHLKVLFCDGSYDMMFIDRESIKLAQLRLDGRGFYERLGRVIDMPPTEWSRHIGLLNRNLHCPPQFIFDVERFQVHGPKHFEFVGHTLQLKLDTLSVVRPLKAS